MTLHAPGWILEDIMRTMDKQIHPGLFVYAGAVYECDKSEYTSMSFSTWGGGALGSSPPEEKMVVKLVTLKEALGESNE